VPAPAPEPEPTPAPVALTADDIARAVTAALDSRAPAPVPTPEPTPEPESSELAELRAKLAEVEAGVANRDKALASLVESGRIGRSTVGAPRLSQNDGEQALTDLDLLIERNREGDYAAPVLCSVVTRHKGAIALTRSLSGHLPAGAQGKQHLAAAHDAPHMLRSLLVAAEHDGIIGNLETGWRR